MVIDIFYIYTMQKKTLAKRTREKRKEKMHTIVRLTETITNETKKWKKPTMILFFFVFHFPIETSFRCTVENCIYKYQKRTHLARESTSKGWRIEETLIKNAWRTRLRSENESATSFETNVWNPPYEIWTPKDNYTRKKSIYKRDHRALFPLLRHLSRFGINLNENWTDANTLKRIQPAWNKFDNFFP